MNQSILISSSLLKWYQHKGRQLPWRKAIPVPYEIWLSENILQQTQMSRGVEYFQKFLEVYPDIQSLAVASEQDVLSLWQGLGYYSRARNILHAAKQIVNQFNGIFPSDYETLISLKGTGDYTACAVLSIAFGQNYAVVDGNVKRVIARLFALREPVDERKVHVKIQNIALELMQNHPSGAFNQAMMDLGAMICKPKIPLCDVCPLQQFCVAHQMKIETHLPIKGKTVLKRTRFFHYFLVKDINTNVLIKQRTEKDIWKGLWELPLLETLTIDLPKEIAISNFVLSSDHCQCVLQKKHILTHQLIDARFYVVLLNEIFQSEPNIISLEQIGKYPVHNLMKWFFDNYVDK